MLEGVGVERGGRDEIDWRMLKGRYRVLDSLVENFHGLNDTHLLLRTTSLFEPLTSMM